MTDKILKFSATWCGPCGALAKTLTSLDVGVPIENIDVDEQTELAVQYHVRSVPTLVYIRNGVEVGRRVGGMNTPGAITQWVNEFKR